MKIITPALTLIELVISISILASILYLGALWQQKIRQTTYPLEVNTKLVKAVLESAKETALYGKEHSDWSVYIQNNSNKPDNLFIFKGTVFSTSSVYRVFNLSGEVDFIEPTATQTITFKIWTGETASTTLKLKTLTGNKRADINILPTGKINIIIY